MSTPDDLTAFCEREWPRLVGALSLYCADRGLAEELAQDALERACRNWARVRAAGSPGAYAHRIAMNLANTKFRRQVAARRANARLATDGVHEDRDVTGDVALREAVSRLPTQQKSALVLRYYADMTPGEIGKQLDCSAQAVRNLTHRAIATLRDELDDDLPLSMQEATDGS